MVVFPFSDSVVQLLFQISVLFFQFTSPFKFPPGMSGGNDITFCVCFFLNPYLRVS